jgi:hypothetical protein
MSFFDHKTTFETLDNPSNKSLYSQTKIIKVLQVGLPMKVMGVQLWAKVIG